MKLEYLKPFGLKIIAETPQDLSFALEPRRLKEWLHTHAFLLFQGFNTLESDALVAYAESIGPLLAWDFGKVMEMQVKAETQNYLFTNSSVPFHWDGAFHQVPRYLLFHCIQAPLAQGGGETLFSHTPMILNNAIPAEQVEWQNIKITYETEKLAHYGGRITQDLVATHPDTGKNILRFAEPVPSTFKNPVRAQVEGYSLEASERLISTLAARCYDPHYCYTHSWTQNDILIADNHTLIHGRNAFKAFSPRHLRRIQIL